MNSRNKTPVLICAVRYFLMGLVFLSGHVFSQTVNVTGTVSASSGPVQNASVRFISDSDTTWQFSALTDASGNYAVSLSTSVDRENEFPADFALEQNYPNPFSSSTVIPYALSEPSLAVVTIYDILGREIRTWTMKSHSAGAGQVAWDGLDDSGKRVERGIYFYRLNSGGKIQVRKMIFGTGEAPASAPNPAIHPSQAAARGTAGSAHSHEYTVRIQNTDNTFPVIVPKQIDAIRIEVSRVLNFTVDEYFDSDAAVIDLDSTQQTISGFGAANILRWRPDMTADQMTKAFGTEPGQVGLSILRLRLPPDAGSFRDNVRTAQAAYGLGVKIIASPWSPPANMKSNNTLVGGRLLESCYADFAAHLKSFADFMELNGVPLFAVSVQNEPDVHVTYESCDWNASEMLRFVKENGSAVGTPIIVPESFNFNPVISDSILNDSTAASHVAIIGGHIYGGGISRYPLAAAKGKELWMTEHLDTDTSWSKVLATGKEIHDCLNVGMNAYIWWYIVRFYGPIGEDGRVTKRGYVMSQFARFVRPGYCRVASTSPQRNIFISAYRDGQKIVIVAINLRSESVEQAFTLKNGDASSFTPYVTSRTENCAQKTAIAVSHGSFSVPLPASSITTFVSD